MAYISLAFGQISHVDTLLESLRHSPSNTHVHYAIWGTLTYTRMCHFGFFLEPHVLVPLYYLLKLLSYPPFFILFGVSHYHFCVSFLFVSV